MARERCKTMNVFQKIKIVREIIKEVFPKMEIEQLTQEVQFLANNWHGKKRKTGIKLTRQQMVLYDLLLKNQYYPDTVYRWLLLATAPEDVKEKLRNQEISIKTALNLRRQQKEYPSVTEREFMDPIINCIETFISEAGENYPGRTIK